MSRAALEDPLLPHSQAEYAESNAVAAKKLSRNVVDWPETEQHSVVTAESPEGLVSLV
jgi:hypothetical protein